MSFELGSTPGKVEKVDFFVTSSSCTGNNWCLCVCVFSPTENERVLTYEVVEEKPCEFFEFCKKMILLKELMVI